MDVSDEISTNLPSIREWFEELPAVYIVFIGFGIALFLATTVMTVILVRNVRYYVPNETVQGDLYVIVCIPFIVSGCCLAGNILVKAAGLLYAVALTYLMFCLHTTICLIIRLFGNRRGLARWLIDNDKRISLDTKPYCCCCKCLPTLRPTPARVRKLSYCVKQSPIVRIFLQLLIMVMAAEDLQGDLTVGQVLNGVGVGSMLLAIYCSHILVTTTLERLIPYNMNTIFKCVNITQMLFSLQKFFLDLLAKNGAFGGVLDTPSSVVSRFWHNVAMGVWVTIVAYVMVRNIRPGKSAFFIEKRLSDDDLPIVDVL